MAERKTAPDLKALGDTYTIVGELRGSDGVRKYIATRREDGAEVVVTVLSGPTGGADHELSHFAADAQLLSSLAHPGLARVLESRWLNAGALAVVTERVHGTTLAESLHSGEAFSNPRTAAVLQEVWGVLDWARASGVVHRGVTPDNVYIEPGTQRVTVALGPTPIPVEGVNDPSGDARTVGALAWSMLTGKPFVAEDAATPLDELAPNLALRVVDATESMVDGARDDQRKPDVPTFIGLVAAGDVLKQAEVELAAMKEEYEEQHRIALAQCENHRMETERMAAEQAELLANERADFEQTMGEHERQLAGVHDQLQQQASRLEERMSEFERRRAEVNRQRSEQERRIEDARHEREQAANQAEAEIVRRERETVRREHEDIRNLVGARRKPPVRRSESFADDAGAGPRRKRLVAAAALLVVLVVAVIGGLLYRNHGLAVARRLAASRPAAAPPQRTAAGSVAPGGVAPTAAVPAATSPAPAPIAGQPLVDPMPRANAADASPPRDEPAPARPRPPAPAASAGGDESRAPAPATVAADSSRRDSVWVRTDSLLQQDSVRRESARRDTAFRGSGLRVDTVLIRGTPVRVDPSRFESIRRDSGYVRDTSGTRPVQPADSIRRAPPG